MAGAKGEEREGKGRKGRERGGKGGKREKLLAGAERK